MVGQAQPACLPHHFRCRTASVVAVTGSFARPFQPRRTPERTMLTALEPAVGVVRGFQPHAESGLVPAKGHGGDVLDSREVAGDGNGPLTAPQGQAEFGHASWWERECEGVYMSGAAESFTKK